MKKTSLFRLFIILTVIAISGNKAGAQLADPIITGDYRIGLETVATGLTAPNWGTFAPGDSDRLFVTDQSGILWAIDLADGDKMVFADLSALLVPLGFAGPGTFDQRGLLGVAFHPDFTNNGLLYTYTSEPVNGPADFTSIPPGETANHQSVITEWLVPIPGDPASVVDPTSARELLRIDQPQFNHNGGALNFGADGMLYISLGDGGGRDDQGIGHGDIGNGQDPSNVLGSILRIDPGGSNSANGQYGIPADNPFVSQPGFSEETFAYGFRNPFRFSFDMETGDLYAGEVGQDDIEEVDVVVAGGNYGWNIKEGSFCFDPNGSDPGFAFVQHPCPNSPPGLIDPIAEYNTADSLDNNEDGRAVIGGFVYRGSEIPALAGRYIFGDYSRFTETVVSNDGSLFYLSKKNVVGKMQIKTSKIKEFKFEDWDRLGMAVLGFGQDASGEIYVLANMTGVPFGDTGEVLKIVRATNDIDTQESDNLKSVQATDAINSQTPRNFRTNLSGREQVVPLDTKAHGQAIFQLNKDGTALTFKLIVANIDNVIGAHIHLAPVGQNGPIVLPLLGNPFIADPGQTVNGTLVEGTATAADISGPLAGDLDALIAAMKAGNTYVNVHTVEFRPGEIRGQIR
jgi:glucose/arabinose dehydrogenase